MRQEVLLYDGNRHDKRPELEGHVFFRFERTLSLPPVFRTLTFTLSIPLVCK